MSGDGAFDYNMRYIRVNSYLTSIHDSDGDYMAVAVAVVVDSRCFSHLTINFVWIIDV